MKILVLGADGMLGHQITRSLGVRHRVVGTLRAEPSAYRDVVPFLPQAVHYGVDVEDYAAVARVLHDERPDAVVNGVGIVKQRSAAKDSIASLTVNALLPHRLAVTCGEIGARLIQVSTDCVFSGRDGRYRETDFADADDLYGRSKLLGEVDAPGCVTLRTSIIGLELSRRKSLIEWFLAQRGTIRGYRRAIYSGLTTIEFARVVETLLERHPDARGLHHVSSAPIDKYTLLCRLRDRLGRDLEIVPDDDFHCDRSLDSSRFQAEFGYRPPDWDRMIDELAEQIEERYP